MPEEPRDDNGYSIFRLGGPFTGPDTRLAQDLTVTEVMAFLSFGAGGDPATLAQYKVVQQYDGLEFEAQRFIRRHEPTEGPRYRAVTWDQILKRLYRLREANGSEDLTTIEDLGALKSAWVTLSSLDLVIVEEVPDATA